MTNDVFNTDATTDALQDSSNQGADTPSSALDNLVGEGKKFKDVEALARGKAESDVFIENLKREMDGMREDLSSLLNSRDVLEQIKKEKGTGSTFTGNTPSLKAEDISRLIQQEMSAVEKQRTAQQNIEVANNKLKEIYGDQAKQKIEDKARELGVGVDFLRDTASKSPTAFYNLVGVAQSQKPQPQQQPSMKQAVNTAGLGNISTGEDENSWSYWNKMRRENPTAYWSLDMHKRRMELAREGKLT